MRVNGSGSDLVTVLSGIPRRSVLRPILFILYINDLPDVVKSTMYLFADGTKLMKVIKSIQGMLDLQKYISEMDAWSATSLIKFNLEKCHVLTFDKPKFIAHPYSLGNHLLDRVWTEKDLVVLLDSNLSFESHMS